MIEALNLQEQEDVAAAKIRAYLEERYGQLQSFEQVLSPHEHQVHYAVAFFETNDGQRLVAKWHGMNAKKLGKELAVSRLLLHHQIPTAEALELVESIPVLIMERLEGRALEDSDLSGETVGEIGSLLRRIHDIPAGEALTEGIPAWKGDTFAAEMQAKFDDRLKGSLSVLPNEYSQSVLQGALDRLLARNTWVGQRALNRRDMHAGNWFRLDSGELAAIDHGNASVGDICYDLAHAIDNLKLRSDLLSAFKEGYGQELFDRATEPFTHAISDLLHGVGIYYWISQRGVPQPRFQAEAYQLIGRAVQQSQKG